LFPKRKILWEPEPDPVLIPEAPVQVLTLDQALTDPFGLEPKAPEQPSFPETPSKNGHRIMKVRDLLVPEKDLIRDRLFLPNNGVIEKDLCVKFKVQSLPDAVSIFQVTGYVTCLHGMVARGTLRVRDQRLYENHIKAHRCLWLTYNSPKYAAMRNRVTATPQQPRMIEPQFEAVPAGRRKVA
jgi:hypothetical protein